MTTTEPWLIALHTEMVLRSRAHQMLEDALSVRRGPKRSISWIGFLVVLCLTVRHKLFNFRDMADLYMGLPDEVRKRFGFPTKASRRTLEPGRAPRTIADKVLDDIQDMWRTICRELDSSPATRPYPDAAQRDRIQRLRIDLCDALGTGWLTWIPHDAHVEDGTAIDGFRNRRQGGDPHARLGHRTPTDRDPRKNVFGYRLVCVAPAMVGSQPQPPYIVLHHELVPANKHEGPVAIRLYRRHKGTGCQLGWVVGDRHVSYEPVDYGVQIARLGGAPIHDLHENLLGQRTIQHAFRVIDSWLWHPDLPTEYWNLKYHQARRIAGEYRSHFAAHHLSGPTEEHPSQVLLGCPGRGYGAGHPPLLDCPARHGRRPSTVSDAPRVSRCPKSDLCRSRDGVWLPLIDHDGTPTVVGRGYQVLPRLSPQWWGIYSPIRALVENVFSTITTPSGANLADRAHRIWGLPGTALWVASGVAIHNHHRLWTWWTTPAVRDQLDLADRQRLDADVLFSDRKKLTQHYHRLFPG